MGRSELCWASGSVGAILSGTRDFFAKAPTGSADCNLLIHTTRFVHYQLRSFFFWKSFADIFLPPSSYCPFSNPLLAVFAYTRADLPPLFPSKTLL